MIASMKYVSHLRRDIEWGQILARNGILGPVYACCPVSFLIAHSFILKNGYVWAINYFLTMILLPSVFPLASANGDRMEGGERGQWIYFCGILPDLSQWVGCVSLSSDDTSYWWGEWGTSKIHYLFHPSFLMVFLLNYSQLSLWNAPCVLVKHLISTGV